MKYKYTAVTGTRQLESTSNASRGRLPVKIQPGHRWPMTVFLRSPSQQREPFPRAVHVQLWIGPRGLSWCRTTIAERLSTRRCVWSASQCASFGLQSIWNSFAELFMENRPFLALDVIAVRFRSWRHSSITAAVDGITMANLMEMVAGVRCQRRVISDCGNSIHSGRIKSD